MGKDGAGEIENHFEASQNQKKEYFCCMIQSLNIGINYRNSPYELGGCVNDAKGYAQRFKKSGAQIMDRWGDTYTPERLFADIQYLAERATATTRTIVTYSGHGTEFPDFTKSSGMGQGICLWDGRNIHVVDDDYFSDAIRRIPGSVFVILDSCYAGGMDRNATKPGMRKRCIEYAPDAMRFWMPEPESRLSILEPVSNKVYWMFACQEDEISWDTGEMGWFSLNFFNAYDNSKTRPVQKVMGKTSFACKPDQTPRHKCDGGTSLKYIP